MKADSTINVITKPIKINECLHAISTNWVHSYVSKWIINIIRKAWNLILLTKMTIIRTNLCKCSMAFRALECRDLRIWIGLGDGKWDMILRVF